MVGNQKYAEVNHRLNEALDKNEVLVAVHRGSNGGNIIENTIPAFKVAMQQGGDMIEIDITRTLDGAFYTFHDGEEKRLFHIEENMTTWSSEFVDSLRYYNSVDLKTDYKVEKLHDALTFLKGDVLINIDRSWDYWGELLPILDTYDMADQLLLKCPVRQEYLELLDAYETKYMYMPIVKTMEELEKVLTYPNINLVGVELVTDSQDSPLFWDSLIDYIHSLNLFVWVNALTLDDDEVLYGGLDDNLSLLKGMDYGWGMLLRKNVDVIQTDWPSLLVTYRDGKLKKAGREYVVET